MICPKCKGRVLQVWEELLCIFCGYRPLLNYQQPLLEGVGQYVPTDEEPEEADTTAEAVCLQGASLSKPSKGYGILSASQLPLTPFNLEEA